MSADYEPGTVAIATVCGVEGVRVMRTENGDWRSAIRINETGIVHDDREVSDVRPLVVLDLDPTIVTALRDTLPERRADWDDHDRAVALLAEQIEAQTRPPRIPEPGLWGVVSASEENALTSHDWVHLPTGAWASLGGSRLSTWRNLIDPTLIREGVES